MLRTKIKNFSYTKFWKQDLGWYDFDDINDLPSKCIVNFGNKSFALSKWTSPKHVRYCSHNFNQGVTYDTRNRAISTIK